MFRQLRTRFIIMTMISVFAVLAVIMTAINLLNYREIIKDSDRILEILSENEGRFPGFRNEQLPGSQFRDDARRKDSSLEEQDREDGLCAEQDPDEQNPDEKDRDPAESMFAGRKGISAETPFESRYFSVELEKDGTVVSTDTDNIATVSGEDAEAYAKEVLAKNKTRGFSGNYRYLVTEEDDTASIIFLDCSRSLSNVYSFFLSSMLVSAVGLAAVMLLVIGLSRRIVRPMQESYDKQKRFITDAGHELKTPLTVISADLSVLEMDIGESEWIDDARMQTERLAKLTNDLVYLSRMDEEQRRVEMIDFPVSDVVSEVSQSFRARAIVEEKQFESSIAPMLSFHGDEKAIRELVSILLDNALKYSPAGGTIRVNLTGKGKSIELSVYNTAEEIDRESINRLFDRFYRTDSSRNSETGGFGLGLAIARAVVTAHKGKISASSEDGHSLLITAVM